MPDLEHPRFVSRWFSCLTQRSQSIVSAGRVCGVSSLTLEGIGTCFSRTPRAYAVRDRAYADETWNYQEFWFQISYYPSQKSRDLSSSLSDSSGNNYLWFWFMTSAPTLEGSRFSIQDGIITSFVIRR